jgi:ferritin-like metal-binding protein YciE
MGDGLDYPAQRPFYANRAHPGKIIRRKIDNLPEPRSPIVYPTLPISGPGRRSPTGRFLPGNRAISARLYRGRESPHRQQAASRSSSGSRAVDSLVILIDLPQTQIPNPSTNMKTMLKKESLSCSDTGLHELFVSELRDILWAEQHILKALPKMEKAAHSPDLKEAFASHFSETEEHVERLKEIFGLLGLSVRAEKCEAMEGLLKEGEELMKDFKESSALDSALITAAQKVEHYEIATYGCMRTFAERLGLDESVELLKETLDEEGNADKTLTEIAESMANEEAAESCQAV